ncbi:MAG: heme exporter protein CcmD [Beijerinckiaceae bacterium]
MLDLGRNGGFILASYAVTLVVISGLVWRSVSHYRVAKRRLGEIPDDRKPENHTSGKHDA